MSAFDKYIRFVLEREGGYVNDPTDSGGETYRGISRKNQPHWEGWQIVDMYKPLKNEERIDDPVLDDLITTFYYKTFWCAIQGDKIKDAKLAGLLLDWSVNSGSVAVKKLQGILKLKEDGALGPMTLAAINASTGLYAKLKFARIYFYIVHCVAVPKDRKYQNGWLARVEALDKFANA